MSDGYEPYLSPTAQADVEARAEEQRKQDERKRALEIEDFQRLMGAVWGRRLLWRILQRSGVFRSSFSGDALAMAFREGERNVGLFLLSEIDSHCPKDYARMTKEANEDPTNG